MVWCVLLFSGASHMWVRSVTSILSCPLFLIILLDLSKSHASSQSHRAHGNGNANGNSLRGCAHFRLTLISLLHTLTRAYMHMTNLDSLLVTRTERVLLHVDLQPPGHLRDGGVQCNQGSNTEAPNTWRIQFLF